MEDFSCLWERHITTLRDGFSADNSVRALTSGSPSVQQGGDEAKDCDARSPTHVWDDKINSVVDALDELSLQSPTGKTNTTTTQSPRTPWFPDGNAYTETAPLRPNKIQALPVLPWPTDPPTPFPSIWPPQQDQKENQQQLLYREYTTHHLPFSPSTLSSRTAVSGSTTTPATTLHSPLPFIQSPPPSSVSALCLSWAPPQARASADGQLFSPSLPTDIEAVRSCFKRRGWRVQCRLIPNDYSTSAVETVMDKFLAQSQNQMAHSKTLTRVRTDNGGQGGELLVVYYHGFGVTEEDGRLRLTSNEGGHFYWDDVRDPLMQHPGDVLLIFDCTAPFPQGPSAIDKHYPSQINVPNEPPQEIRLSIGPGLLSKRGTKQILGVCVPSFLTASGTTPELSHSLVRPASKLTKQEMVRKPRTRPRSLLLSGFDLDDLEPSGPADPPTDRNVSQREPEPSNSNLKLDDTMTTSLCRILDRDRNRLKSEAAMGVREMLSVQRLCSLVREDIRQTSALSSTTGSEQREATREVERGLAGRVFVTQLGGGQIADIYLPCLGT